MHQRRKRNSKKSLYVVIGSLLILSSISIMVYKHFNERQINKLEETCNESDSKQDISSNER